MKSLRRPSDDCKKAVAALAYLSQWRVDDRDAWLKVGMALYHTSSNLFPEWDTWSKQSDKYDQRECPRQWKSFKNKSSKAPLTIAILIKWANDDSGGRFSREQKNNGPPRRQELRQTAAPRRRKSQPRTSKAHSFDAAIVAARASIARGKGLSNEDVIFVKSWNYENESGGDHMRILRFNLPTIDEKTDKPEKAFRPLHKVSAGWVISDPPGQLPVYGLLQLTSKKHERIYLAEGEGCAEAFRSIGLTATTSAHGSNSARQTDWQPLADHAKEVIASPDNSPDGQKYVEDVFMLLRQANPDIILKIITLPDVPLKGDIVDYLADRDWIERDEIEAGIEKLADDASPWEPPEEDEVDNQSIVIEPVTMVLSSVTPEPVRWLWPGRIPMGKVSLLAGDPGLGKSLLGTDIASRVSQGIPFVDSQDVENPKGSVIILSAEDDISDTIRPRLDAAGADCDVIVALQGVRRSDRESAERAYPFSLEKDLHALECAIGQTHNPRLVIIDPISAYLGRIDSHKNTEIRAVLAPLAELAGRRNVAILAITHLRKGEGPAMYRPMGSLAFVAAARASWLACKDQKDPTGRRRLLLPVKNNLAADSTGLAYSIDDPLGHGLPCVTWERDPVSITADEALAHDGRSAGRGAAVEEATEWLKDALGGGSRLASELRSQAETDGIAERTLARARKTLGVTTSRHGFGKDGEWRWAILAPKDANSPKGEHLAAYG